ncbi:MAG: GCN5-related N-acetyltransferase [Pacificimonas sp.]
MDRAALEQEWLRLTRDVLPELATTRGWPIRFDHCFQRVLLDQVFGGVWYGHVSGRPAYRHLNDDDLRRALLLAGDIASGRADLAGLNRQSLSWRRAAKAR